MYDDVLVATDGSDVSAAAAAQGIAIAETTDATVHVLSVAAEGRSAGVEELLAECESNVEAVAADATEAGRPVESAVREGRPAGEILAYAEDADVDLIVVGTHGRTGLRQVLLGSVALEVIRDARPPVLTVGADATGVPREVDDVLLATDGWSGSDAATAHAISLAEACDARLDALYVVDVGPDVPAIRESFEEHGDRTTAAIVERAEDRGLAAERSVERGEPHDVILERAERGPADLLVMGTESKSGLERMVVGSVSQRVVPDAPVPVVTARTVEE